MKSTNERLAESYCKPKTEEEWAAIAEHFTIDSWQKDFEKCGHVYFFQHFKGILSYAKYPILGRTEVPVSHFLDLRHDTIAPWRLEEDGFSSYPSTGCYGITINDVIGVYIMFKFGDVELWVNGECLPMTGITTYTQLLTLIRLIG